MRYTSQLIVNLKNSPLLLKDILQFVPNDLLKQRRIPEKWSIHEHVCHLALVEQMMRERLQMFIQEERPVLQPYCPGESDKTDLMEMNLHESIDTYERLREEFIQRLSSLGEGVWLKQAEHSEYKEYTPYIMARHLYLHDNIHLYRIEELWLTRQLPGD